MSDAQPVTAPAPEGAAPPEATQDAPATVTALPQRRQSAAERKRHQRERAAEYRQRKAAQRAETEQAHVAEQAQAEATRAAAEKVAREALANKETMVRGAIGGTVEALADTAHLIWLRKGDPRIGDERSRTIGELWAPILAPLIDEQSAKVLLVLMASGGTASALYGWAHEVARVRAEGSK